MMSPTSKWVTAGMVLAHAWTLTAQADEPDVAPSGSAAGVEYFEQHVRPVLVARCYKCHSERDDKRQGGLVLDYRAGWATGGDSGPAIEPGDPEASLLIRAIRYTDPNLKMPPDEALPSAAVERLAQWVRMGAPDPRHPPAGDLNLTPARAEPSDPVAGRSHWAFRPLVKLSLPPVVARDWPRSPLDYFILARLESADLKPAVQAEATDLVRRLYVQLTGLPPTAAQVRAYADDPSPEAFERLVDQLLSSPQFGERWGRHWLDLARYADSNGLDENFLFREAWRYRNNVIEAVNADTPFDRFVLEQLAGDLLPYDSLEQRDRQRIAAGFLVVGPKVLLGNDEQKQRLEVADEQLDTIGRALLGQTLGCARCHNHKFDPIPTADYYALAGILTSTQVMERRFMLGEQRVMERLVGLGSAGDETNQAYEQYWRDLPRTKERRQQAQAALELLKNENQQNPSALSALDGQALADGVRDATRSGEQRVAAQQALVAQLDAILQNPPPIPPRAMIPTDAEAPAAERIRLAGQFDRPAESVPRGFLRVLSDPSAPVIPDSQSGRPQLATWLTDTDHGAGQLAARVLANRIWHHLIGGGIVRTVDNFGRTGEAPTHPELLDYLADELIQSGWSIKSLVRQIVLSRTFSMSSCADAANEAQDPENRLLGRAHRRRLDPETLRDSMLMAAGQLDLTPRESTVSYLGDQATGVGKNVRRRTDFPCRSVYLPVIRNDLPELFAVFDFADPHATTGARPQTTVPAQGLFLLNNELVMDAAEATARRILAAGEGTDPGQRVELLFELILSGRSTEEARQDVRAFVQQVGGGLVAEGDGDATLHAWSLACHAVFASSGFQFLE